MDGDHQLRPAGVHFVGEIGQLVGVAVLEAEVDVDDVGAARGTRAAARLQVRVGPPSAGVVGVDDRIGAQIGERPDHRLHVRVTGGNGRDPRAARVNVDHASTVPLTT